MKNTFLALLACCALVGCTTAQDHHLAPTYKIANRIPLGGDGFWDYLTVDEAAGRLFVSHGTQVQVVNLADGKLLGAIPDLKGVHGIALATRLNKGFISCGRDSTVRVFDLQTLAVTGQLKVTGENPDAILYDSVSNRVFTFNHNSANATAIDAATNEVTGTIALDGSPEFAVSDGRGTVFVNIEDKSEIAVLDTKNLKVLHNWPLKPGQEPTGLAFDVKNERLFSVCDNGKMVVLDASTGRLIQTLPIGEGVDGVAFDPVTQRIFSSNGEGTMTVVEETTPDQYRVLATVPTQKGARTIAVDTRTHHLYLPTADREATQGDARPKVKPGTFTVLEVAEAK